MKKYDVVALGELLIDFTQNGISEQGNPLFEANPGGAPCNVLSMLSKLGHKTAFIGKTLPTYKKCFDFFQPPLPMVQYKQVPSYFGFSVTTEQQAQHHL